MYSKEEQRQYALDEEDTYPETRGKHILEEIEDLTNSKLGVNSLMFKRKLTKLPKTIKFDNDDDYDEVGNRKPRQPVLPLIPFVPTPRPIPHRCPVCSGKGIVPNGFYSSTNDTWSTTSTTPETCRSCGGSGVIMA